MGVRRGTRGARGPRSAGPRPAPGLTSVDGEAGEQLGSLHLEVVEADRFILVLLVQARELVEDGVLGVPRAVVLGDDVIAVFGFGQAAFALCVGLGPLGPLALAPFE